MTYPVEYIYCPVVCDSVMVIPKMAGPMCDGCRIMLRVEGPNYVHPTIEEIGR